jgi:hypothetical protein
MTEVDYQPGCGRKEAHVEFRLVRGHGYARVILPAGVLRAMFGATDDSRGQLLQAAKMNATRIFLALAPRMTALTEGESVVVREADFGG